MRIYLDTGKSPGRFIVKVNSDTFTHTVNRIKGTESKGNSGGCGVELGARRHLREDTRDICHGA